MVEDSFKMTSRSALWFLGMNKLLLLLLSLVSGTLGQFALFDTVGRGTELTHTGDQTTDYLSAYVQLSRSIKFAGTDYNSIGVSSTGLIYFGAKRDIYPPDELNANFIGLFPLVLRAEFSEGSVKYLEVTDADAGMDNLGPEVGAALSNNLTSPVEWLFIVTWENGIPFSGSSLFLNTFQVVLASDGQRTCVIFNYGLIDDGQVFRAQAGFIDAVSQTSFYLPIAPGDILYLVLGSNDKVGGRWIYDVTDSLPVDCTGINPCLNGGTCDRNACTCAMDFTGTLCDEGGDPCEPNPCLNGGTCTGGECSCPVGYGGNTCEEHLSTVRCDSTSMTVVLDTRLLPEGSSPSDVHFLTQDDGCVAEDYDSSRIEMSTMYNKCGTTIQEDANNVIFRNYVTIAKPSVGDDGALITREYHQRIQIECCLDKVSVLTGKYKPKISKVSFTDKELGMFSLKIAHFTGDEYDEEVTAEGGVVSQSRVMLGSKLYFGVVLDSTPNVGVVIKSCWATPAGPETVPRQDLINDQCSAEDTLTITRDIPLDVEGFSFDAFRFTDELSGVTKVFIHCDVVVCTVHEATDARSDPMCGQAVNPTDQKVRRDVSSSLGHTVSFGPIAVYSAENSFAANSQDSQSIFGTRAYIVGIVAVVSMVTIWGVVKGSRRKSKLQAPGGEYTYLVN